MKRLTIGGLLCVAALIAAQPAAAEQKRIVGYRFMMPPAKYDVPYEGKLTIWWVSKPQQIREFCPKAEVGPAGFAMACAKISTQRDLCDVYVVKNPIFNGIRFSLEAELRHELAHCNGWANHDGGKITSVSTPATMPKLPESTRWLPAYPPAVCITADRIVEPCSARKALWPETASNESLTPKGPLPDALKNYRPNWK